MHKRMVVLPWLVAFLVLSAGVAYGFPMPSGQNIYTYGTQWAAVDDLDPAVYRPIFFDTSGDTFDMHFFLRQFDEPVDAYVFLYFPAMDPANFYLVREDRELQNLDEGLVPWRKSLFQPFDAAVVRLLPDAGLTTGKYYFGLMVTRENSVDDYYFWITELGIANIEDYVPLAAGNMWQQVLSFGPVPSTPRDFAGMELGIDSRIDIEGSESVNGAETWRLGSTLGFYGNLSLDGTGGLTLYRTGMPSDSGNVELLFDGGLSLIPQTFALGAEYTFQSAGEVSAPGGATVTIGSDGSGTGNPILGNGGRFTLSGTFRAGRQADPAEPLRDEFLSRWEIPLLRTSIRLNEYITVNGTSSAMALPVDYSWGLKRNWGWKSCFADFPGGGMDDLRVKGRTSLFFIDGVYRSNWGQVTGWMPRFELGYANSECSDPSNEWAVMASYKINPRLEIPWTVSLTENGQPSDRFSAEPETGTGETDIALRVACGKIGVGDSWNFGLSYRYLDASEDADITIPGSLDVSAGQVRENITVSPATLTGNFNYFTSSCATRASWHDVLTFRIGYRYDWTIDGSSLPAYADFQPASGTGDTDVTLRFDCLSVFTGDIDSSIWISGHDPSTGEPALNSPLRVDLRIPVF